MQRTIWTIGHSNRAINDFISLLKSFNISIVADIRSYPGSRKYPHFNKDELQNSLKHQGISYVHLKELGGRRKPVQNSANTAWRNDVFRGFADYMQTDEFRKAAKELEKIAALQRTAYMCSEAVWWSCHRSLVSDYLKLNGWRVEHIMSEGKAIEHPYTKPARIVNGELHYDEPALF
ncbi:MAG: DUF488 domain-containing protein [Chitinophagaceae bacterium]|nr:DUF488 domain-containing protein [Chitinophagaceae bacterium]